MVAIYMINPRHYEPWDYTSPDSPGIGGSETYVCEMAWRLAERGHRVTVYAPLPQHQLARIALAELIAHKHVEWRSLSAFDATLPGLYILVRGIELLDRFDSKTAQRIWAVFQDVDTLEPWKEVWFDKIDRIIGLCSAHCAYLKQAHPDFALQICQSRNGMRGDLVDQVLTETYTRNPHRLMYASSPDRGLMGLLQAFKLIRFLVPDAELHIFYGFDNLQKLEHRFAVKWQHERTLKLANQPGVFLRGRLGQPELYREWTKSGLMVAPTNFTETGYISLLEAQALGAIPVCNPLWAAEEYQVAGIAIEGDGERDVLTLRRYAMAAVHLMRHPELQDDIRQSMINTARKLFDWSGVVDQYATWMQEEGL